MPAFASVTFEVARAGVLPRTRGLLAGTILRECDLSWAEEFSALVLAWVEPPAVCKIRGTHS